MAVVTRGVLFVHSAARAVCPHVEWATGRVLGMRVDLEWTPQPLSPALYRTELSWQGEQGTGALLASALRGWSDLRYEVTEEPSRGCDGARFSHVPDLGLFHAVMDVHGNTVVPEDRVRAALAETDPVEVRHRLETALGSAWDRELEPVRHAGDDAQVRWLHRVG
ncbi:DUF3145 domain-containing protein [Actinosynnema sp.]|uniref:DUF3145 domain-containing protein n=1 Tax=Actinosynnema sp. TaxID=1872144 RepID=UPI003F8546A6